MVNINNFFDLYDVFINELIGDLWLALFLGLTILFIIGIRSRLPYQISILTGLIWVAVVFAANTGLLILWTLTILGVGAMFYYSLARVMRRG